MKVCTPPAIDGDGWQIINEQVWHAKSVQRIGYELYTFEDKVIEHWIGSVTYHQNFLESGPICAEYDLFGEGVVIKQWGFEEDVIVENMTKFNGAVAVLHQGKWYQKEVGDDIGLIIKFSEKEDVPQGAKLELSDANKRIEIVRGKYPLEGEAWHDSQGD